MKTKTRLISTAACIIAALAFSNLSTQAAANVLVDPNFDLGVGWTTFNGAHYDNTGPTLSAPNSMNLITLNNVPGAFEQFPAVAGDAWSATGSGYTPNPLLGQPFGGASFGGLQITFFDAANNNLGTVETSPGNALFSNMIDQTSPAAQWIPLAVTAHAPAGTDHGQVFAIMIDFGAPAPEGIYVDNMSMTITSVPEPSSIAMLGMGLLGAISAWRGRK